jgi:hypothetical protein
VALVATAAMTTGLTTLTEAAADAATRSTNGYALRAMGYGTRLIGGQVPTGSKDTAFQTIACSARTGLHRSNDVVQAAPADGVTADGVRTDTWTARAHGGVHSYTRSSVATLTLVQSALGTLKLTGITSLAHAWHNRSGFHAQTEVDPGVMTLTTPAGSHDLPLPTPEQPVTVVPNLARIALGHTTEKVGAHSSTAIADALDVTIIPTGSRLRVAHAIARTMDGVKHGRFGGFSAATRVEALDGKLTSGRNPLSTMPCQGTQGQLRSKELAGLDLGGQVVAGALRSEERGRQLANRSVAMERGSVGELKIGGGQLVVKGIVGQANVTRRVGGRTTANALGTTVGTVIAGGRRQTFPPTGVLEIPGVGKLERHVVKRTPHGISVVGLRITLLDGAGVIDLGVANAYFRR